MIFLAGELSFAAFMWLWLKVDKLIMLIIFGAYILYSLPWSWLFVEFIYGPPKSIIPLILIGTGFSFNLVLVTGFLWFISSRKHNE